MKFSRLSSFLFAACMMPLAAANLDVGNDQFDTCDYREYDLLDGGSKVGYIQVFDDVFKSLTIKVAITSDAPEFTLISRVYGQACCPDGTGCLPFDQSVEEGKDVTLNNVQEPICGEGKVVDITVNADLKTGGVPAFNAMFDPPPHIEFWVTLGREEGAPSYLDMIITNTEHEQLLNKRLDAFCIDVNSGISVGDEYMYTGKLYSWLDAMSDPTKIPNVANPQRLDSVAYCINAYQAGTVTKDGESLTSGTLQRAIWYVLGDGQSTSGLGDFNDAWAQEIAADCTSSGDGFVPGCNDLIPLVVVPQGGAQNLYAQTQLAALDISCRPSSATAEADALCEPSSKTPHGGGFGDPHFMTWTGELFDFQGACDVVLAQSESFGNGAGFAAHLRLAGRYDYSYIETAAVKIGNDVLEVSSWGEFMWNGVLDTRLPKRMDGKYEVTMHKKAKHNTQNVEFYIKVHGVHAITIASHKDLVSIKFLPETAHLFFDAEGLMGDFHHGARLARDGKTVIKDENEFGQEWQVRPGQDPVLFSAAPEIEYPARCVIPKTNVVEAGRRLEASNITEEAAAVACRGHGMKGPAFSACVYDVMATGDLDAAMSGAF